MTGSPDLQQDLLNELSGLKKKIREELGCPEPTLAQPFLTMDLFLRRLSNAAETIARTVQSLSRLYQQGEPAKAEQAELLDAMNRAGAELIELWRLVDSVTPLSLQPERELMLRTRLVSRVLSEVNRLFSEWEAALNQAGNETQPAHQISPEFAPSIAAEAGALAELIRTEPAPYIRTALQLQGHGDTHAASLAVLLGLGEGLWLFGGGDGDR